VNKLFAPRRIHVCAEEMRIEKNITHFLPLLHTYQPYSLSLSPLILIYGSVYVANNNNHRIVEWKKGATIGQVVASGKGAGH
jgi:hypothetical protein